jgi:hypothetical protein
MNDPDKPVDLMPHEWESDREKPKEPFWGTGLSDFVTQLIGGGIVLALVLYFFGSAKPPVTQAPATGVSVESRQK